MHCPSTILIDSSTVMIIVHTNADYRKVPFLEKINIFRYEIIFKFKRGWITLNRDGIANARVSNFIYKIKCKINPDKE